MPQNFGCFITSSKFIEFFVAPESFEETYNNECETSDREGINNIFKLTEGKVEDM